MITVIELKQILSEYPDKMEIKFWISSREEVNLLSDYLTNKTKNKPQHLNIDLGLK